MDGAAPGGLIWDSRVLSFRSTVAGPGTAVSQALRGPCGIQAVGLVSLA